MIVIYSLKSHFSFFLDILRLQILHGKITADEFDMGEEGGLEKRKGSEKKREANLETIFNNIQTGIENFPWMLEFPIKGKSKV